MGGSLDVSVGEDRTTIGGDVLTEFGPEMAALVADVALQPAVPRVRAAALEGGPRCASSRRAEPAAADRAGEIPGACSIRDHPYGRLFPDRGDVQGLTRSSRCGPSTRPTSEPARPHLYVGRRFDGRRWRRRSARPSTAGSAGLRAASRPPKPAERSPLEMMDRPGRGAVHDHPRHAGDRSFELRLDRARRDELAAGRVLRLADHRNIREHKGYTYSPNSASSPRATATPTGSRHADVTTAVTGASLKEILAEIKRLQAEPPPPTS